MRIHSVMVQGFRGAGNPVTLDCQVRPGEPADCVILQGDNGSGKSTFIDAIEFALTASVGRRRDFNGSIESFQNAGGERSLVAVVTDEGTKRRHLPTAHAGPSLSSGPAQALRRRDLTHFVATDERSRHHFFAHFVSDAQTEDEPSSHKLERKRRTLKGLSVELEAALGLPESEFPRPKTKKDRETGGESLEAGNLLDDYWRLARRISQERRRRFKTLKAGRQRFVLDSLSGQSERLTEWFREVSPTGPQIRSLSLSLGDPPGSRVGLDVQFKGTAPSYRFEQALSEANQDLLVLLLYLITILERNSQVPSVPKVLLLDDVLQSVDGIVRSRLYRLMFREFSGWQLVFAVTDRLDRELLWQEAARAQATRIIREFDTWSIEAGPNIFPPRAWAAGLRSLLQAEQEPHLLSAIAGRALERLSNRATQSMRVAVARQPDDKYTLADTWNPLRKKLSSFAALRECVEHVDGLTWLRNTVGAHENPWAFNVSRSESREFVEAVARLIDAIWCENCQTTLAQQGKKRLACPGACLSFAKQ